MDESDRKTLFWIVVLLALTLWEGYTETLGRALVRAMGGSLP